MNTIVKQEILVCLQSIALIIASPRVVQIPRSDAKERRGIGGIVEIHALVLAIIIFR